MTNLTEWANAAAGRYIDVDGWAGAQCWDLSQAWLTACNGGTLWTQPSRYPGLAAGSWEVAMANGNDMLTHVTAHPGTDKGQPGDIIIWAYGSADYPISHTAVLIEDRGPILHTLSQNSSPARPDLPGYSVESSGPSIYQDLPRAGILGFLRPRATITGQASGVTPITKEGFLMALTDAEQTELLLNVRKVVGVIATVDEIKAKLDRYLDTKISAVAEKVARFPFKKQGKDEKGKAFTADTSIATELGWQDANFVAVRKRITEVAR